MVHAVLMVSSVMSVPTDGGSETHRELRTDRRFAENRDLTAGSARWDYRPYDAQREQAAAHDHRGERRSEPAPVEGCRDRDREHVDQPQRWPPPMPQEPNTPKGK